MWILGFWRKRENLRVEGEGAGWGEDFEDFGEGDGQDGGPEETGCDGPAHTDFTVGEREYFGGVGPGDGSFSGGVKGCEDVDEGGDKGDVCGRVLVDEETESGGEEGPGHLGEGEEEEGSSTKCVDGPDGWPAVCHTLLVS